MIRNTSNTLYTPRHVRSHPYPHFVPRATLVSRNAFRNASDPKRSPRAYPKSTSPALESPSRGANEHRTPAHSLRCRGQSDSTHARSQYHASPHRAHGTNSTTGTKYSSLGWFFLEAEVDVKNVFATVTRLAPFLKTPAVARASLLRHDPSRRDAGPRTASRFETATP